MVGYIKAVDDVSFELRKGETFGLVGESGCGKTTLAKCILLLESLTSGQIKVLSKDIAFLNRKERREYRSTVQAVFQDPYSSLNPRMRVQNIIAEPLQINTKLSRQEIKRTSCASTRNGGAI